MGSRSNDEFEDDELENLGNVITVSKKSSSSARSRRARDDGNVLKVIANLNTESKLGDGVSKGKRREQDMPMPHIDARSLSRCVRSLIDAPESDFSLNDLI